MQVELRVLAHLANDESLLASFDGPDLFRAMAARLFRISDEVRVTAEMRNKVKAVTYAMLYGAGFARVVQASPHPLAPSVGHLYSRPQLVSISHPPLVSRGSCRPSKSPSTMRRSGSNAFSNRTRASTSTSMR